ncbi:maleylpyruvate isomerase family mycothiol-dependent enzyme [Kitasatospora sp. NPDC088346]|uniref:maleylpyruvate isomerase family mycothiol-dependent enzyme n=1 Tax=Kitasatospora sp. NPDC088346 TaxID=3364073 RepID=UPI00382A8936
MDYVSHFRREVRAFEAAVRRAAGREAVPLVPSCPGWSVSDLVLHLGSVHRAVAHVIRDRPSRGPDAADLRFLRLPDSTEGWPAPEHQPNLGPVPPGLGDWFTAGARELAALLADHGPAEEVWTWSPERSVGFWRRIQAIEAAVHRWDAEDATGAAQPVDAELARDAVAQTFTVMAPARRAWRGAPDGSGERYRLRESDGPGRWTAAFEGTRVSLTDGEGGYDVELAGTASDLMLFLWGRLPADRLAVTGDRAALDRYFTLVPPV